MPEGPSPEEIAARAYALYEARGGRSGSDVDDWLEAERSLSDRRGERPADEPDSSERER